MNAVSANYHTHTFRCNHASGADRDYVENAVRAGFELLGFSDHAPMPFPDGHESPFRMKLAETAGYFESVARLREEYAGQIRILLRGKSNGFKAVGQHHGQTGLRAGNSRAGE